MVKTAPSPVSVKTVPAVIQLVEAAAALLACVEICARTVRCFTYSRQNFVLSCTFWYRELKHSLKRALCAQAVLKASMENDATKSAIVPKMAAATGPMEPVYVILDFMDASVTFVSPMAYQLFILFILKFLFQEPHFVEVKLNQFRTFSAPLLKIVNISFSHFLLFFSILFSLSKVDFWSWMLSGMSV